MASGRATSAFALGGLGVALAVGGVARFWNLTGQSLFTDEAFVFDAASRSVHDLLMQIAYHDAHPPLFYLMTHWLMGALHWPVQQYRYLTSAVGMVTIVAAWGIGRRLFGDVAGVTAAVVVALEPSLVALDRLYRMYAVLVALSALSW